MHQKTHTQTHTQNEQPYLWIGTAKPQKVTSDIKSRSANFKGAPGKALWKNPSRKRNTVKMDPHHTVHHAAPS